MIPDDTPYFLTRENLGDISGVFYIPKPSPLPPLPKVPMNDNAVYWFNGIIAVGSIIVLVVTWYFTR